MLCPQCNEKIKNRDATRNSPACRKCRYQFVFFPNEEAKLTDNLFAKKLKAISPDNSYYFTVRQLYYYILNARALEANTAAGCFSLVLIFAGGIMMFVNFLPGLLLFAGGIGSFILLLLYFRRWKLPYGVDRFKEIAVKPWELFKGKIEKLLPETDLSFNNSEFKDIMDYSFDALIITGDNQTANFLIKNDFHFKNKTAIVSYNKYPGHLFPYVIDQVKKNPDIPVFLVHDADIIFAGMKQKIEKSWFGGQPVKIFDLGLHPRQVFKSKKFITYRRANVSQNTPLDLSAYTGKEQKWFKAGNYGELSYIPPVRLLNILEYCLNIYKEKGPKELQKVANSVFMMGLGVNLPKAGAKENGDFELDFGSDFG